MRAREEAVGRRFHELCHGSQTPSHRPRETGPPPSAQSSCHWIRAGSGKHLTAVDPDVVSRYESTSNDLNVQLTRYRDDYVELEHRNTLLETENRDLTQQVSNLMQVVHNNKSRRQWANLRYTIYLLPSLLKPMSG